MSATTITLPELQAKIDEVSKRAPELVKKAAGIGGSVLVKEMRRRYLQVLKRRGGNLYDSIQKLYNNKQGTRIMFAVGVGMAKGHSQIYKGATHEMGKVIQHPGGQPYFIGDGGRAVFVSKDNPDADKLPKTKPYSINIPRRSFVAPTRKAKLDEVRQLIADELLMAYDNA